MASDIEKLRGDHPIPTKDFLKRTFKYLKPEWWAFLLAFFFIILNVIVDAILPMMQQMFIDGIKDIDNKVLMPIINIRLDVTLAFIIWLAVSFLILSMINQAFLYIEGMILQKAGQRVVYRLRMEVFEHIERMSINQFNDMPVGSLVTRVASYTNEMSALFTDTIVNLIRNLLTVVTVYAFMLYYSWRLSLILLSIVVVVFIASLIFRHYISKIYRKQRALQSDFNSFLSENLSGMKIIQLFVQEKRKKREFDFKNKALLKQRDKMLALYAFYRPFITFTFYGALAMTFILGVSFSLTAGEILAFYLYVSKFFNPIESLADQLNNIQRAKTASERLFNLLDVKPEVLDKKDAIELDHIEGKIEFKNVWFAYEKDNWILKDVSFVINPKETCAFVGPTGSGKTTILSLIVRNYEVQKGEILIDGINVKDIKIESLRKLVGQMLQDVFLFSGTIKNNITLHDDSHSDTEVMDACKYVNADHFISKLENGLNSEVIERGENFSQGQRQLLSFARTVLHKPQLLILDEATANIDTETEKLIQESLEKMKSIGTMLVVAHRLSTIQSANQIICLQNGEVVETGNHQKLLKNRGYYYKLYQLQFADN